jgi:DNA topoisomerase-1
LNGEQKDELNPEDKFEPTRVDTLQLFDELAFPTDVDFSDVRGQYKVRRAVEIAAAGGHNMIMVGPPGAGKSMIAKRIPTILPPLTLEEALELFQLPRTLGDFEGSPVVIGAGRFGPYILHQKKYTSLPKGTDPMAITLEEAVELINEKRQQENQKHMKIFVEDAKLEVLNGRYGPYLAYDGKNYRLPKNLHAKAAELTYAECMAIIEKQKK